MVQHHGVYKRRTLLFDLPVLPAIGSRYRRLDGALVEKAGSWFSCNGQRLGQGREQTVGFLKANPKLGEELIAQLKGKAAEKILQPA